jgi:hypothetical protein
VKKKYLLATVIGVIGLMLLLSFLFPLVFSDESRVMGSPTYRYKITLICPNGDRYKFFTNNKPVAECDTHFRLHGTHSPSLSYLRFKDATTNQEKRLYPGEYAVIIEKLK